MNKLVFSLLFLGSLTLHGQSNLSFFHMQNTLPQASNYNASYFPNAKVYISLPAISGIDLSVNNSFGLSDVLTKTGDSTLIDINRFLGNQKKNSFFNIGLGITDLMVGVRLGDRSHISFFVNERMNATLFYPIDLLNFLWQGNAAFIGENYVADDLAYNMTYYREWGVGYSRKFLVANRLTNVGVRLKYLTGIFHSSTQDIAMSIYTNETDYSITAGLNDSRIRSAGFSKFEEDNIDPMYFIHNGNRGFGLDLGAQFQYSEKLRFGAAVNDIGFINWKDYAESIELTGTSFTYEGINLDNLNEFGQALQDSLDNIQLDTIQANFATSLNARSYFTADYQVTKGGYAQATVANFITQGKLKSSIGLGYLQNAGKWLSVSATASLTPQQGVDFGGGLMLRMAVVQIYAVADNILNTIDIPNARSVNFKFGMNFLIGKHEPSIKMPVPRIIPTIPEEVQEEEVLIDSVETVAPVEAVESEPEQEAIEEPVEEQVEEVEEEDPFADYSYLWEDDKKKKK